MLRFVSVKKYLLKSFFSAQILTLLCDLLYYFFDPIVDSRFFALFAAKLCF